MSDIKDVVKEKYGQAALRVTATGSTGGCGCGTSCCSSVPGAVDPITVNLYDRKQTEGLPAEAVLASLGCGNPTALAQAESRRGRPRPRVGRRHRRPAVGQAGRPAPARPTVST